MISRVPSTPWIAIISLITAVASCSEALVVPSCLAAYPTPTRFATAPTTLMPREAMAISELESLVPREESLLECDGGEGGGESSFFSKNDCDGGVGGEES
jgi:hypothetical protein